MVATYLRAAGLALCLCLAGVSAAHAQDDPRDLAGIYDGSQTEIAAALELRSDGRYRFKMSYGALDEWSAGTWKRVTGGIVLASDPFTPPAFEISDAGSANGRLSIRLSLPDGYDPQYFAVNLHRKDGSASFEEMAPEGLDMAMGDNPVVSLRPALPVMDLLGPEFAVPAGGAALTIAFKPNDLGFAGFAGEVLRANGGGLEMMRYGRTLRFRRVAVAN